MIVLKFGGTSVGTAERMKHVASIIQSTEGDKIVVLSAMAGTTNELVDIAGYLYQKEHEKARELTELLEDKYIKVVKELFVTPDFVAKGVDLVRYHFDFIKSFTVDLFTVHEERAVLAQGELISTALLHYLLSECNISSVLLPALNFMRIDKDGEPDAFYIRENLARELRQHHNQGLFITQGFICRNAYGEIDNLKRGGSDYTATLIGVAAMAEEIQIWTDIDGMHNNDPRYVSNTHPLKEISYDEAAELAYFGAKILHPSSVMPAKVAGIPVLLKNTLNPQASGTTISVKSQGEGIRAIAAKDHITAIRIKSGRMLMAYGFLRKVFEIFESYRTSIDMITTSEVSVSVTIDDNTHLDEISRDLKGFGIVEVEKDLAIICIVGEFITESRGHAAMVFQALQDIPIRMISFGGSRNNISLLVKMEDKVNALRALNKKLFENE